MLKKTPKTSFNTISLRNILLNNLVKNHRKIDIEIW